MENKAWDVMLEEMIHKSPPVGSVIQSSIFKYINEGITSSLDPNQKEPPDCNTEGKIHPADKNTTRESMTKMLRGASSSPCEFRLIQPDGSLRHIRLMISKVQNRRQNQDE